MQFKEFRQVFQRHVADMLTDVCQLYVTDVDKDELWNLYLDSFPPGTNEVFRERREFDCSCCRQFIKQFGNVITLVDNKPVSIWGFVVYDGKFQAVLNALNAFVASASIKDAFITKQGAFGTDHNFEQLDDGQIHTWHHFRLELPRRLVTRSHKSEAELRGELRASRDVFQRSLEEISKEAVETVLDLIAEKSLYRGEEWRAVLQKFLALHNEYHMLPSDQHDGFLWSKSVKVGGSISRIRNHSIGVLLQDITDGMDVVKAVKRFEKIVAPANYQRPKAIYTKRMVEQAQETVERLGLLSSLGRRHAKLDDIRVNNVLWANRDAARHMRGGSDVGNVFELLAKEVALNPRQFDRLPGVDVSEFVETVLPNTSSIEALVENRHQTNLMSLIAPKVADSPTLFKWDNAFSWTYNGNIADSMRERVKAAGGNVEGVLRFSLQWNDGDNNQNDFDAHCIEPGGNHIYYPNKRQIHRSSGVLDVDIINPGRRVAVENITWSDPRRMPEGEYHFYVRNYSHNGGRTGFSAEIEFSGQIYEYVYDKELMQDENVTVARVHYSRLDGFKITESLPSTTSTREIWNLQTNQFQPVSTITYSPNYWDEQHGIGNRHYFFFLVGCQNPGRPNGFYNEYLREDFREHRRVFEALGSKMHVERSEDQLSGLGFSSTRRNSLVVKVDGRPVKVIF
jgi:hypothetical protein